MHRDGVEPEEVNAENPGRHRVPHARTGISGAGHPVYGQIVAVAAGIFLPKVSAG